MARYFLDDSDGAPVPSATDAIDPPASLSLAYSLGEPSWTASATGRALAFSTPGLNGHACSPVTGKVFDAFDGATEGTLEAVVDYTAGVATGSRIAHIGIEESWTFSIGYSSQTLPARLWFSTATTDPASSDEYRRFAIDLSTRGRTVLTLVFDLSAATGNDRARMYADGVRLPIDVAATNDTYAASESIVIPTGASICVGNRQIGGRAPLGSIGYAAFYDVALDDDEIQRNVMRLRAWDDR